MYGYIIFLYGYEMFNDNICACECGALMQFLMLPYITQNATNTLNSVYVCMYYEIQLLFIRFAYIASWFCIFIK